MLPQEKCWVYKEIKTPKRNWGTNKTTCLNYCIYGKDGKENCPKWEGEDMADMINQPPHYTAGGIETIDIMRAKLTKEQLRGYLMGNVIKYITRYPHKGGVEDLHKCRWYLDKLIEEEKTLYAVPKKAVDNSCYTCKYEGVNTTDEPCVNCDDASNWEQKETPSCSTCELWDTSNPGNYCKSTIGKCDYRRLNNANNPNR